MLLQILDIFKKVKTLTVANSGSAVAGTTTGSNTGDITDNDTDANNDSLTVTHIQHSGAGSSTSVTNVTYNHGSATSVDGTYGTLPLVQMVLINTLQVQISII